MKGRLILTDISTPVEGMKVVISDGKKVVADKNGVMILYIREIVSPTIVKLKVENTNLESSWGIDELKQVAIEHKEIARIGKGKDALDITVIPLHPDDYERAVGLIGQEVEFKMSTLVGYEAVKTHARISLPTPEKDIQDFPSTGIRPKEHTPEELAEMRGFVKGYRQAKDETEHLLSTKANQKELLKSIMQLDEEAGLYEQEETWHDISVRFMKSQAYSKHLDGLFMFLENYYLPPKRK